MTTLATINQYKLLLDGAKYKVYSPKTGLTTYLSRNYVRAYSLFKTLAV